MSLNAEPTGPSPAAPVHPSVATAAPPQGRPSRWRSQAGEFIRTRGSIVALILLVALFAAGNPIFLSLANIQSIFDAAAVVAVIAVGETFVILTGAIDLSIEGIMALSAVVIALLVSNDRNSTNLGLLAIPVVLALGALMGLVAGLANTRLRIPSFMATLGTWSVCLGLGTVLFGGQPPIIRDQGFLSIGHGQTFGFTNISYIAVIVVLFAWLLQRYTRFGRYAYVIGGGEDVARLSGVNVDRYKKLIFMFSGTMFALAAVLATSELGVGDVGTGRGDLFAAITAVVVGGTLLSGGKGSVPQSLIGALIIAVLANGMILSGITPLAQQGMQGAIILVVVALTGWPARRRLRVIK